MPILKATETSIRKAAECVRKGGLIIYPTDTVYGLGCDPFYTETVNRVFETKGEKRKKPLPILGSEILRIQEIAYLNMKAKKVAAQFWPGPLTLVVAKRPALPEVVTSGLNSVAVRIPNHNIGLKLINLCGGLIVGTSANKTGNKPPKTATEATEQIGENVDMVLDAGPTPLAQESTILDLTSNKPKILREGPIKFEQILNVLRS